MSIFGILTVWQDDMAKHVATAIAVLEMDTLFIMIFICFKTLEGSS